MEEKKAKLDLKHTQAESRKEEKLNEIIQKAQTENDKLGENAFVRDIEQQKK